MSAINRVPLNYCAARELLCRGKVNGANAMRLKTSALVASAVAGLLYVSVQSASALPAASRADITTAKTTGVTEAVRYRGRGFRGRGYRRWGGYRRGYGYRRYGYRRYGYGYGNPYLYGGGYGYGYPYYYRRRPGFGIYLGF